ncbi:MAG TPA: TetR/AcrR family transcriptional regulator [Amycolatopsis sp.]|nr:TetR/AcrR family transcriptional regulator [Amycolatopsis sp.]
MTKSDAAPPAAGTPRMRRDTARTRDRLLATAGDLLAERGPTFSLPDLARASGVATATVYRHFADVHEVFREFYQRLADELATELAAAPAGLRGRDRFQWACGRWVDLASGWGRAATRIRSPAGFLERVRTGDPLTSALHAVLEPIVAELIEDGACPAQEMDYAILVWITLFDERVIVDLASALDWPGGRITSMLSRSVLNALGAHAT